MAELAAELAVELAAELAPFVACVLLSALFCENREDLRAEGAARPAVVLSPPAAADVDVCCPLSDSVLHTDSRVDRNGVPLALLALLAWVGGIVAVAAPNCGAITGTRL